MKKLRIYDGTQIQKPAPTPKRDSTGTITRITPKEPRIDEIPMDFNDLIVKEDVIQDDKTETETEGI